MIHVTCRLTAKNRDQLRNPTLSNRVWTTFTFLHWRQLANTGRSFCSASNTNMGGANVRSRSATWLLSGVRSVSVGGKRPQGSGAQRCRCHSQLITFSPRWHFVTVVPDLLLGLEKGQWPRALATRQHSITEHATGDKRCATKSSYPGVADFYDLLMPHLEKSVELRPRGNRGINWL